MKKLRPYQQEIVDSILKRLRESDEPILIDASVGSGKSLILSSVLLVLERAGFHAICLTLNSTLIQQNSDTYKLQGGNPSLYAACLNTKDCENFITFATPNSVCQDIRRKGKISQKPARLIIIDEVHNLDIHNESSMYVRILKHYSMLAQEKQYSFKIIGLSGTCYRGKSEAIYGEKQFFKSKLCSISTSWLIKEGYLTKPYFGLTQIPGFDFSQLRVNNLGKFNGNELQAVLDKNERLTADIMREVISVVENSRQGAFIFASTRKHCEECKKSLPEGQSAIITGETPHEQRRQILEAARAGSIKYLINVNCLTVGVDVPSFDVCAWLRPTESLVLYTQGIGRVLRLHPGKESAIILDYSGNLDRHGDIDDPIINEALQPQEENEKDYCIPCYTCETNNTIHARRCIGIADNKRCEHFFTWKDCHGCGTKNDATSRHCRECKAELIDPNAKLKRKHATLDLYKFTVEEISYTVSENPGNKLPSIKIFYSTACNKKIMESYTISSEKAKNIFYGQFVRVHFEEAYKYYPHLHDVDFIREMMKEADFFAPDELICSRDNEFWKIKKKVFNEQDNKSL